MPVVDRASGSTSGAPSCSATHTDTSGSSRFYGFQCHQPIANLRRGADDLAWATVKAIETSELDLHQHPLSSRPMLCCQRPGCSRQHDVYPRCRGLVWQHRLADGSFQLCHAWSGSFSANRHHVWHAWSPKRSGRGIGVPAVEVFGGEEAGIAAEPRAGSRRGSRRPGVVHLVGPPSCDGLCPERIFS